MKTTKFSKADKTKATLMLVTGCCKNKIAELFSVPVSIIEKLN